MSTDGEARCTGCGAERAALRLVVTQTVWWLLDVTDDGIYPHQPEADGEPLRKLLCLDCGREGAVPEDVARRLRFEN